MTAKKEILLITNYFPPERGAAANRMWAMAENFHDHGYEVEVICPLPNYPEGAVFPEYREKLNVTEHNSVAKIHRLWIWPSKSTNKLIRLLSMISFAFSLTLYLLLKRTPKTVLIQYSPVFVGFTGILWSWLLKKRRILNISDLWPLAGLEMGLLTSGVYYKALEWMERFCYRRSHLVIGQSHEILRHVQNKTPQTQTFLYRNIPDFQAVHSQGQNSKNEDITLVYAGLLGMAQGLYEILSTLHIPKHISVHVYGGGPESSQIETLVSPRVQYHGEVTREVLHKELKRYDVAFIPLVKRIYGSVPSKIFEYTRLGMPVLYYAGGEGGEIVEEHGLGWTIPVGDQNRLQDWLNNISRKKLEQFPKVEIQGRSLATFDLKRQFEALLLEIADL